MRKRLIPRVCAILSLILALSAAVPSVYAAQEGAEPVPHGYVERGLVSLYSGTRSRRAGHDPASAVWEDLVGSNDVTLSLDADNRFVEGGFQTRAKRHCFPQALADLVNGAEFTVEIRLAAFQPISNEYAPLLNCTNDSLSLFRRGSSDALELKYAANAPSERPTVPHAADFLRDALITVSYAVGGECRVYLNGELKTVTPATKPIGADDLFFGHDEVHRRFSAVYRSMRFYQVALTAAEARRNAAADGYTDLPAAYVERGLVSLYSGTRSRRAGHDPASAVWEDLVGSNNATLSLDADNRFVEGGFQTRAKRHFFPQALADLVNGEEFTVEIRLAAFQPISNEYAPLLNCTNDSLSLFRRGSTDALELKYAANAPSARPTVPHAADFLRDALITVSYTVGGECRIYLNGERKTVTDAVSPVGANDLFFDHDEAHRLFSAVYRSIRFYNVALTDAEARRNAAADGCLSPAALYVEEGLVSLYSGLTNTKVGFDAASPVWADLAGPNDIPVGTGEDAWFTRRGLFLRGSAAELPPALADLLNSDAFSVEVCLEPWDAARGGAILSSRNGEFALSRSTDGDKLMCGALSADQALEGLRNGSVALTRSAGGRSRLYLNGQLAAEAAAPRRLAADALLIGCEDPSGASGGTYRSLRFYNRELTPEEVAQNAQAEALRAVEVSAMPRYITVAQPVTRIVGGVAAAREINTADELLTLTNPGEGELPAAAVFRVNESLDILDDRGEAITTVERMLHDTGFRVIPAFTLPDRATAEALTSYLNSVRFTDVFLMSADPSVVQAARRALPAASGIIDCTEAYAALSTLTEEQCLDLRRLMKSHEGTIALLPAAFCRRDTVRFLFDRQVNVWARIPDAPGDADVYDALLSGAAGVLSDDVGRVLDVACRRLPAHTITRMPLLIGHRGVPTIAPENTLEGAALAFEKGADVIELDVYLTSDGQLVVMHDGSTGRTCDRNLPLETSTLAQLKELYVNRGFEGSDRYAQCRIPTLAEFLAQCKGTDCRLFIEIKGQTPGIAKAVRADIEAYGMYGQCSVITFHPQVMEMFRRDYPEMSVGALCSGFMTGSHPDAELRQAMNLIGPYNATLNPAFSGYDDADARAAMLRGVSIYPWTFQGGIAAYRDAFLGGYAGLTGNDCQSFRRTIKSVDAVLPEDCAVTVGDTLRFEMRDTYFPRGTRASGAVSCEILAGADCVEEIEGGLAFVKAGEVTLVLSHGCSLISRGDDYALAIQPVTLQVREEPAETPTESPSAPPAEPPTVPADEGGSQAPPDGEETDRPKGGSGCASAAWRAVALLTAAAAVPALRRRRREDPS